MKRLIRKVLASLLVSVMVTSNLSLYSTGITVDSTNISEEPKAGTKVIQETKSEIAEVEEQEKVELAVLDEKETKVEEQFVTSIQESSTEEFLNPKEYEGKITNQKTDSKESSLEVEHPYSEKWGSALVTFAIYRCDLTKCVGFGEDGLSSIMEGRRGGNTVTVCAPKAREGYVFSKWIKVGTIPVGIEKVPVDVYEAIYVEVEKATVSEATKPEENSEVVEPENCPEIFQEDEPEAIEPEEGQNDITEENTDKHVHIKYTPENGEWTEITSDPNDENITITYKGCHCYVSFAKFICDINVCKGFNDNGTSEMTESRRGGCTVTVCAPEAKEGYVFSKWVKVGTNLSKIDGIPVDVYKAEYIALEPAEPEVSEQDEIQVESDLGVLEDKKSYIEEQFITSIQEFSTEELLDSEKYEGKITIQKSASNERILKVEYPYSEKWGSALVTFAIYKCDLTRCVGFGEDGSSSIIEGRRGGNTVIVCAPEEKDGYVFSEWTKVGTIPVGIERVPVDVYEAKYVEVEETTEQEVGELTASEYVEPKVVQESQSEVTQPEIEAQNNVTEQNTDVHQHVKYTPENGEWTEITSNPSDKNIMVSYKGCHCYVSFAKFICDINVCKGFNNNGTSEMTESRRGGCTVTVCAPEAKDEYVFAGWKKVSVENNVDVYEALYVKVEEITKTEIVESDVLEPTEPGVNQDVIQQVKPETTEPEIEIQNDVIEQSSDVYEDQTPEVEELSEIASDSNDENTINDSIDM